MSVHYIPQKLKPSAFSIGIPTEFFKNLLLRSEFELEKSKYSEGADSIFRTFWLELRSEMHVAWYIFIRIP